MATRSELEVTIPVTREGGSSTFIEDSRDDPIPRSEGVQRLMNVAIASLALILVSPIMILFAALVKLTSAGPIFYSQARVGLDRRRSATRNMYDRRTRDVGGRPFMIYKFRTMCVDAEGHMGAVWATKQETPG